MKLDFFCRVHTVNPTQSGDVKGIKGELTRLPHSVVVIDTETVEDLTLEFEFGCYVYAELVDGTYAVYEEGIFFRDDLNSEPTQIIRQYAKHSPMHLGELPNARIRSRTRTDFVKNVFWPTLGAWGRGCGPESGF